MLGLSRSRLILALLFAFALAWAAPAAAATLTAIRHSTDPKRTRVVIDLDAPVRFDHRALTGPARILIEFPKGKVASQAVPVSIGDGYVQRARINALEDGRVQVVLDLARPLEYSVSTLSKPDRIVVDVTHSGAPAPTEPASAAGDAPAGDGSAGGASTGGVAPGTTATPPPAPIVAVPPPRKDHWVVAVDAGHGGKDPGAQGHGADEKDIVFVLAREVVAELNRREKITAFPVRAGNYFIPLPRRRAIAEKDSADVFVSIHCNASKDPRAKGTEVYFLSLKGASDEAAREVARYENAADERMGLEPESPALDQILFDMMQADVLVKSQLLAEKCLGKLFGLGTVYDRGVKQAGFVVLKSPRIPSVLVESAFISNRDENKLLRSGKWQREFARLLADGIEEYLRGVERAEHLTSP